MMSTEVIKVIILITLLFATFLFSMLPVKVMSAAKKQVDRAKRRRFKVILSLLSCFSAGVFLGTCLLDLFPGVQDKISQSFNKLGIVQYSGYPVSEFILVVGLFIILIIEQVVLTFKEGTDSTQYEPLLSSTDSISSREHHVPPGRNTYTPPSRTSYQSVNVHSDTESEVHDDLSNQELNVNNGIGTSNAISYTDEGDELTESQMYQDPNSHSVIRTIILLLALSLHSIFEGLAIGLQRSTSEVLGIFAPVALHKSILAFSLGMNLVQTDMKLGGIIKSNVGFAITSPIGIGIGLAINDLSPDSPLAMLVNGILQGIACGTFLYVVFFEILPHEFMSMRRYPSRLLKTLFLILGYATVASLMFFDPDILVPSHINDG